MSGSGELAKLAEDLGDGAAAISRAADGVIREAATHLEVRLRGAGNLASNVTMSFPAPRTAVVGATKRFGVYAEAGTTPVRLAPGEASRAAQEIAAGLVAAAGRLLGGKP